MSFQLLLKVEHRVILMKQDFPRYIVALCLEPGWAAIGTARVLSQQAAKFIRNYQFLGQAVTSLDYW